MKILVLQGSPRKKDGFAVTSLVEKYMQEEGEVRFEHVYLSRLSITECRGCSLCFQKGEEVCPLQDDVDPVRKKMQAADGIIFVSPVYAIHITASLKKTIDRLAYLFHRPELIGKPALTIVTTDGSGLKEVSDYLKMVAVGWGCNLIGSIKVMSTVFFENRKVNNFFNAKYHSKVNKEISCLSGAFYKAVLHKPLPVPTFYDLFMFNGLRSKTYVSPADHAYWKERGWLSSSYYYKTGLGPVKRLFGFVMHAVIKRIFKKLAAGEA